MENPYAKKYADLTEEEKDIWKLSYEVLTHGDRLYGTDSNDTSHLGWSLGVCLDILRSEKASHPNVFMLLELGVSDDGYSIRVLSAESTEDSTPQASD